jgi:dihydrofolate reductase
MRKIFLFMMVSADGYFEGPGHDLSWHNTDKEFGAFVNEQNGTIGAILMGHTTYDLMAGYWPTAAAQEQDPGTSKFMTETPKFVAAHRPFEPGWENVTVVHDDVPGRVRALKQEAGKDIAIFGSNMLCVSLMEAGLVDEYRLMVNPLALGAGTPLFTGLAGRWDLVLARVRDFASGNVLLTYQNK